MGAMWRKVNRNFAQNKMNIKIVVASVPLDGGRGGGCTSYK